jgi:signal transduction histidine kinase
MRPSSDEPPVQSWIPSPPVAALGTPDRAPGASHTVSSASRRLRALATLSGSLTDALGPEDAAHLVERKALSALSATSAVVVTLGPFPPPIAPARPSDEASAARALTVVHAIGLPDDLRAALEELPLDAPVPMAEVARLGNPLFLPDAAAMRHYPAWAEAMIAAGANAAAIVPVWANGELRGVLALTWNEPRDFDEDERAFVLTLGVMCAQAIMRAHLRSAERLAREAAELANRSKSRFLAMISHELRTPMNAVLGYTELLADELVGPVNQTQKDHLGRVRASGRHLLELVEELLGYARVEAGEEIVRPSIAKLSEVVESSLVLVRPLAEQKGLHIHVEAPDVDVELHTDERKVRQIIVNLLANAVKFSEVGEIIVVLRIEGIPGDVTVVLEVSDSGRGVAASDFERIFEPFWQADQQSSRSGEGTGLGLSVARQLARLLGGDVVLATSQLGRGATFVVTLPARYRADAPSDEAGS